MIIDVLKSMVKRKLVLLFILIQLVFAYLLIVDASVQIADLGFRNRQMKKYTDLDLENSYRLSVQLDIETEQDKEKVIQLERRLNKSVLDGDILSYGTMDKANIVCTDRSLMEGWMDLLQQKYGDNSFRTEALMTDSSIYNRMKLNVSSGRLLEEEDFTQDSTPIPVLVGASLSDLFPVGSEIQIRAMATTDFICEIVGILNHSSSFINEGFEYGRMENLDYRWVMPFPVEMRNRDRSTMAIRTNQGIVEGMGNKEKTLAAIREISEEQGITIVGTNLQTQRIREEESSRDLLLRSLLLSVILVIVAISGVISSTLSSLEERRYELGVRLAIGYTRERLSRQVALEILILNAFGLFVAYGFRFVQYQADAIVNIYSPFIVLTDPFTLFIIVTILCLILIISIRFPIRAIRKLEIVDLLRGGE